MSNEEFYKVFPTNEIKTDFEKRDLGKIEKIDDKASVEITQMGLEPYATCELAVSYENSILTYMISFDQDMKLAGLYVK